MTLTKPAPATYADIKALPENMVGQILFGALYAHPRPAPRHALASNALGYEVTGPFQRNRGGPGGWVFMVEPELHLGEHVIVPDLAGWKRGRLAEIPDTAYIETPPDWICEVLSPSTQRVDRTDKLEIYAQFEVGYCWYVDPDARTLEVFERTHGKWLIAATFKAGDDVTAPPFEAHTFPINNLWPLD
ncbi:MAG: Uma2 family endonuclease [Pseudomonadota bacterium]